MKVLVVESPNKARTIASYLDRNEWVVIATTGHIVDLPVNIHGLYENDNGEWIGEWIVIPGKEKIVSDLRKTCKGNEVYIATDDDVEGEKIAGDVVEYILIPIGIQNYKRVVFHEITKDAVSDGLNNARKCDEKAINAQIARRFVDRETGYKMSNYIRYSLKDEGVSIPSNVGIGRVVSPALHLLVEREKEVMSFVEEQKYKVVVEYMKNGIPFSMTVPVDFYEHTLKEMNDIIAYINNPEYKHIVASYRPEITPKSPYPPLITSRLQRGAWYLYGMSPDQTMRVAQDLFHAGLITYHRTESYNLSDIAVEEIITYLRSIHPDEVVVQQKRLFRNRAGAHSAHEAIRPTSIIEERAPGVIEFNEMFKNAKLAKEHADLYAYIWFVAISTQLADALYDTSSAVVQIGEVKLLGRANVFALGYSEHHNAIVPQSGWRQIYGHLIEPAEKDDEGTAFKDSVLPRLQIGEELSRLDIKVLSTTTRRPPRYGIGRFITTLENKKIGRPSTFATIYKKLISTKAVGIKGGNMLVPTTLGISIDDWITKEASWLNSIEHTVDFHEKIDLIESGEIKSPDGLVKEYSDLVAAVASNINWIDPESMTPSEDQIKLAKKIIESKGMRGVDTESLFSSRGKMKLFLDANKLPKKESIGKCPACNNDVCIGSYTNMESGEVMEFFACENKKCSFRVWDKTFDKFFVQFKVDLSKEERVLAAKKILSKKSGYQFLGFIDKTGNSFEPFVCFEEKTFNGKTSWFASFAKKNNKMKVI